MIRLLTQALFIASAAYSLSAEALTRRIITNFRPTSNKVKVAVFDADSTFRVSPQGKVSANGKRDFFLLPFVTEKVAQENDEGALVMIGSNQFGAGKYVSIEDADDAFFAMRKLITHFNPRAIVHYHDFAEFDDEDRKPGIGMLLRLERELEAQFGAEFPGITIDKERSFVCGDAAHKPGQVRKDGSPGTDKSDSDRMLAVNYHNIKFIDPSEYFEWVLRNGPIRFHTKQEVDAYFEANPQYFQFDQTCPDDLKSSIPDKAKRKRLPPRPN